MKNKQIILTVDKTSILLPFLIQKLNGYKRNTIKSFLTHKQVDVSGKTVTRHDYKLNPGMQVTICKEKIISKENLHGVKIIFEDDDLIVVDKPAGILSVQADRESGDLTVFGIIRDYLKMKNPANNLFVIHRLDRDTSGLMMFVKSKDVLKKMRANWYETVDERCYTAIVEGIINKESGVIISDLKQNKSFVVYSSNDESGGKRAETHYTVIKRSGSYSMLDVKLETGRKNQIRVHMKDIGHSVAGDVKYGAKKTNSRKLFLHASVLAFTHPVTGKKHKFVSKAPEIFSKIMN